MIIFLLSKDKKVPPKYNDNTAAKPHDNFACAQAYNRPVGLA